MIILQILNVIQLGLFAAYLLYKLCTIDWLDQEDQ
jgi:hypothetical protein